MTRIKITLILLALFLVVAACTSREAQTLPDAAATTTDDLLPEIPGFEGVFEGEVNAHLYLFNGAAGQVVSIGMIEQDPQLDPYLVLMGPTGAVYAADDDGGDVGVAAAIRDFTLPIDGTYFVLATSARGRSEGPVMRADGSPPPPQAYRLTYEGVTEVESIQLDKLSFTALEYERGTPIQITLTQDSPIKYVPIQASAGESISIITEGDDFFTDTLLYIFDDSGQRIAVNDDVLETESKYARIEGFTFPRDGRYLVMVTVYVFFLAMEPDWQGGAPFTLRIE